MKDLGRPVVDQKFPEMTVNESDEKYHTEIYGEQILSLNTLIIALREDYTNTKNRADELDQHLIEEKRFSMFCIFIACFEFVVAIIVMFGGR